VALGLVESLFIICKFRPTVIVGMGGFSSFPPVLWGILLGIPTVIHEVNAVPGLVNRLLAPHVDLVTTAYAQTARLLRARRIATTGVPLRRELLEAAQLPQEELKAGLGLDLRKRTVLVLGGSRGAAPLNRAILRSRVDRDDLQILLVTGGGAPQRGGTGIIAKQYLDRVGEALAAADLVISRAGAATIAELTALGKPAILVPWLEAAENHQELNARLLEQAGGAIVLPEGALEEVDLVELARKLLAERERLRQMADRSRAMGRPDGLQRFLEEVERLLTRI
jgi:UDP-N-acetylglucosamine--N-acetylmuramyl-(pentapeptide) pyrophosphoryl-undecaprenol N-acetylglucosamine transferase